MQLIFDLCTELQTYITAWEQHAGEPLLLKDNEEEDLAQDEYSPEASSELQHYYETHSNQWLLRRFDRISEDGGL